MGTSVERRLQRLALGIVGSFLIASQAWAQSVEDCEGGFALDEEDYFCFEGDGGIFCGLNDESFIAPEEEFFAEFGGAPDDSCTGINPPSEVLQNEFQRLYMTDYLYRFSGVIQNRFFGNRRGGGGVAGHGNNDLSGRAAGDGFDNWSPWISYARTRNSNDLASTAYEGTADSFLLGADYTFSDRLVAGVSLGYDDSNIDTTFNGGGYESEGYTIAPYVAYLLTDTISIDGTVGYSNISIDQSRINPIDGNMVTSDTDSDRWFIASNINKFHQQGNFFLLGRAGFIYSEDDMDGFTERGLGGRGVSGNTAEFGQIQIGGEVAYSVHAIEPYTSVYYLYDFENETPAVAAGQPRPSGDDDEWRLSGGFRYFGNNGFSAVFEYSGSTGRDHFDSHTLTLIGRMQF